MTGSGIESPTRSAVFSAIVSAVSAGLIGLAVAGVCAPAWAQTQPPGQSGNSPTSGPTSLLPPPANQITPAQPTNQTTPAQPAVQGAPATSAGGAPANMPVLPSTPPVDNPVQVQQLGSISLNGFGTLDESHGGLPTTLWAGSDPGLLDTVLAALGPSSSRSLQGLIRRVLLSVGTAPSPANTSSTNAASANDKAADGDKTNTKDGGNGFLVARARALWAIGDSDDLVLLLKSLPTPALTPPLRRLLADAALLSGDTATACSQTESLTTADGADPYPVELRVYCQFASGQAGAASLGVDVLREEKVNDPPFFTMADALVIGSASPKAGVANPSPLILAMSRLAKVEQPAPADGTSPGALRAIALGSGTPLEIRLAAGERAEAVGALDTDTLRRLAESVPFTADDFTNAEAKAAKESPARGRALLLQAAERQSAPLAKVGLMARLLNGVQGGPGYFVAARLLAPQIAGLQPTADVNSFAPTMARALLAARMTDAARNWIGWARAQALSDKSLAEGAAGLAVLARIAKLSDAPPTGDAIAAWIKAGSALAPERASRRKALGFALLAAFGDPVPLTDVLGPSDSTTQTAAQVPNPVLMLDLDLAAAAKRTGETLLLSYLVAGDGSWTQLDVATIARLVATLKATGFEDDARAVALEAALANGV